MTTNNANLDWIRINEENVRLRLTLICDREKINLLTALDVR